MHLLRRTGNSRVRSQQPHLLARRRPVPPSECPRLPWEW